VKKKSFGPGPFAPSCGHSPMLAVADLRKSFVSPDGERVDIVDVASFTLGAGEQLALRGESGSGKTTFLNLIAGILARTGPRDDRAWRCGVGERARSLRRELGSSFRLQPVQGTGLENVSSGCRSPGGADRGLRRKWERVDSAPLAALSATLDARSPRGVAARPSRTVPAVLGTPDGNPIATPRARRARAIREVCRTGRALPRDHTQKSWMVRDPKGFAQLNRALAARPNELKVQPPPPKSPGLLSHIERGEIC